MPRKFISHLPADPPTPDPLPLLLHPRVTLEVLEYLSLHQNPSPKGALGDLGINLRDWYKALARLEALNLVAIERFPGTRVRRGVELTAQGKSALHLIQGLRTAVDGSQAALELVLAEEPPKMGSREAGDLLLRLLEYTERRADYGAMKALEASAKALGRPGEAAFAAGLARFLQGDRKGAVKVLETAVAALEGDSSSRSYRRASYYFAAALDAMGDDRPAYVELTRIRRLAQAARDDVTESDARLGIAILKAKRGQWIDSWKQLEGALHCAERTGSPGRQAKVLTSLCLADFMLDYENGLARSDEALAMAKRAGGKILVMHIRANRALMFAYRGDKKATVREMAEARRISREAGYEPGIEILKAWGALSRRIIRYPPRAYPLDLRDQVSALLRSPRTLPPEELPD